MNNASGITLTHDKVLLAPIVLEEKTEGGIVIPKAAREREDMGGTHGILVDCGPTAREMHELRGVEPGDIVLFSKFAGTEYIAADGVKYRIIKAGDVLGKTAKVFNPRYQVKVATAEYAPGKSEDDLALAASV
jgi:chaperonin GroES